MGGNTRWRLLRPDDKWVVPLALRTKEGERFGGDPEMRYTFTVWFTDSEGVRWQRTDDATPHRLPKKDQSS